MLGRRTTIRVGAAVFTADGVKLGKVERVSSGCICIGIYWIPFRDVVSVTNTEVHIALPLRRVTESCASSPLDPLGIGLPPF